MLMELNEIVSQKMLDATGLSCPLPLLRTKKTLANMEIGEILEVLSSDPGSQKDIPKYCNRNGNIFLGSLPIGNGVTKFFIKKG
jgi:tRNA 2-thiouridine synthesizing protein A